MTRTHVLAALAAAGLLVGLAIGSVAGSSMPLVATTTPAGAGQTHAQVAAETSCSTLLGWYQTAHNVWRGGVKKNREPVDQLDLMREILRRKGKLERAGRCGG